MRRFMKESKLLYKVSGHHEHQLAKMSLPHADPDVALHKSSVCVPGMCTAPHMYLFRIYEVGFL